MSNTCTFFTAMSSPGTPRHTVPLSESTAQYHLSGYHHLSGYRGDLAHMGRAKMQVRTRVHSSRPVHCGVLPLPHRRLHLAAPTIAPHVSPPQLTRSGTNAEPIVQRAQLTLLAVPIRCPSSVWLPHWLPLHRRIILTTRRPCAMLAVRRDCSAFRRRTASPRCRGVRGPSGRTDHQQRGELGRDRSRVSGPVKGHGGVGKPCKNPSRTLLGRARRERPRRRGSEAALLTTRLNVPGRAHHKG